MRTPTNISELQPWVLGPFELLRHAQGHLDSGGDTDRRLALIGFDNATEVCIDVFLGLHPRQRGGLSLTRDQVQASRVSYHSKIEFLEHYLEERQQSLSVSVEAIIWYHTLRNDLYHSGNGMLPERHAVIGAQAASLSVFRELFNEDLSVLLGLAASAAPQLVPPSSEDSRREFLHQWILFDHALVRALMAAGLDPEELPATTGRRWRLFASNSSEPLADETKAVEAAQDRRDRLVHGEPGDGAATELRPVELTKLLRDITRKVEVADITLKEDLAATPDEAPSPWPEDFASVLRALKRMPPEASELVRALASDWHLTMPQVEALDTSPVFRDVVQSLLGAGILTGVTGHEHGGHDHVYWFPPPIARDIQEMRVAIPRAPKPVRYKCERELSDVPRWR